MDKLEEQGPGVEFYPMDPLSRGMVDRLRVFNRSLSNLVYLPYEDMDDSPYMSRSLDRQQNKERYQVGSEVYLVIYVKMKAMQISRI